MPSQIFAENGTAWQRKECCQRMVGVFHGTTIARRHHNGAPSEPIDNDWRLRASTLNHSDQGLNLRVNHQYISPLRYLLISFCFNLADVWALERLQQKRETPAHAFTIARQHDFTIDFKRDDATSHGASASSRQIFWTYFKHTYCVAISYLMNFVFASLYCRF